MHRYSVKRNGVTIANVEADDCKIDFSGPSPVFVFQRDKENQEARMEVHDKWTPYFDDIKKPKKVHPPKKEKEKEEKVKGKDKVKGKKLKD